MRSRTRFVLALVSLALAASAASLAAQAPAERPPTKKDPIRFTAFAVQMQRGISGQLNVAIERWSTDAERDALIKLISVSSDAKKDQEKLRDALEDIEPRVGFIRTDKSLGYDLRYAWQHQLADGSRQVVIATDKPVSFLGLYSGARTLDYTITLIEMRFPAGSMEGEGKLLGQTTVSTKDGRLEIEIYGQEPTRLTTIKQQKRKGEK